MRGRVFISYNIIFLSWLCIHFYLPSIFQYILLWNFFDFKKAPCLWVNPKSHSGELWFNGDPPPRFPSDFPVLCLVSVYLAKIVIDEIRMFCRNWAQYGIVSKCSQIFVTLKFFNIPIFRPCRRFGHPHQTSYKLC